MAKKPTITTITTANNNVSTLNSNFNALRDAFDAFVSRDGETPNTMVADLDMNSQDLLNAASVRTQALYLNGVLVANNNLSYLPEWKGVWATTTAYDAYDLVREGDTYYICLVAHTSGTFATDLADGDWAIYFVGQYDPAAVAITGGTITGITDLAVADGGTGASTAAAARTNLGLVIGTNVQAYNALLADIAGISFSTGDILYYNGTNIVRLPAGSNTQVLTLAAGVPSWAASAGGGSTPLGSSIFGMDDRDAYIAEEGADEGYDEEFDGSGISDNTLPTNWSWMDQGSGSDLVVYRQAYGHGRVDFAGGGTDPSFIRGPMRTLDGTTWQADFHMALAVEGSATYSGGVFLQRSANDDLLLFAPYVADDNHVPEFYLVHYTDSETVSNTVSGPVVITPGATHHGIFRIIKQADDDYDFQYSPDGACFFDIANGVTVGTELGGEPDRIGFGIISDDASHAACEWFRVRNYTA